MFASAKNFIHQFCFFKKNNNYQFQTANIRFTQYTLLNTQYYPFNFFQSSRNLSSPMSVNGCFSNCSMTLSGMVAILLQMKLQLHVLVARLGDADIKAIMQFVLISCIILPVLPDQAYGWYDVLNPREIWWMVVLVVGISLGGYVVWKFFGQQVGIVAGGILGGR